MQFPNLYLTIDDSPSMYTTRIVDALQRHQIPAVFFARGEFIEKYRSGLIYAIERGFLVGNHSYSHPHFSNIPTEMCLEEIRQAEHLIDACYKAAHQKRPAKVIRLPWSDRGAGPDLALPQNAAQEKKYRRIQDSLKEQGFRSILFTGFADPCIDAPFSWKTGDFREEFIKDKTKYIQSLENRLRQSSQQQEILMLHDFNHNYHLFELALQFFIDKNIRFLPFEFI